MLSRQRVVLNTYSYTGFLLFTVLYKLFSGECGAYLLSRSYSNFCCSPADEIYHYVVEVSLPR